MSETTAGTPPRPGLLDRLLRLFSDVRPGESVAVTLMVTNLFLILVGYYIAKTVREPLILASGGAELATYAAGGQALALMGFIPLYGWFASRVDRARLLLGVTAFFIVNLELFYLGARAGVPYLGVAFFIWVGIFSLAIIAQFWSYANDVYSKEQGDRLFPVIAIGATAGSWVGSKVAQLLFEAGFKPYDMLHIAAAILAIQLVLYRVVDMRLAARRSGSAPTAPPLGREGGFTLVLRSPYIRLIALVLIVANLVNTTGEYILRHAVVDAARAAVAANPSLDRDAFIGAFYGRFFFYVNLTAVLLQALVASRLVRYLGLAGVLLALPSVDLVAYGLIAAGAGFTLTRWAKTADNATDYSIMNTAKAMLWLPTTREEKYKAKQTVDTFFVRAGDVLAAGLVYLGTTYLGLSVGGFAGVNLLLIAAWVGVVYVLLREHKRLLARQNGRSQHSAVSDGGGG